MGFKIGDIVKCSDLFLQLMGGNKGRTGEVIKLMDSGYGKNTMVFLKGSLNGKWHKLNLTLVTNDYKKENNHPFTKIFI